VEGDYNHQWIELLLLESYDLSDCTLEYRAVSADEAYHVYYTFESGSFYNAGNLIRLYNGTASDTNTEPI
jgi:hypothetical protein